MPRKSMVIRSGTSRPDADFAQPKQCSIPLLAKPVGTNQKVCRLIPVPWLRVRFASGPGVIGRGIAKNSCGVACDWFAADHQLDHGRRSIRMRFAQPVECARQGAVE